MNYGASIPIEKEAFDGKLRLFNLMPRFSPEINAGHLLTAATIIVSVAVIYGTQSAQLEAHKEWLKRHDALLDKHSLNLNTRNLKRCEGDTPAHIAEVTLELHACAREEWRVNYSGHAIPGITASSQEAQGGYGQRVCPW